MLSQDLSQVFETFHFNNSNAIMKLSSTIMKVLQNFARATPYRRYNPFSEPGTLIA